MWMRPLMKDIMNGTFTPDPPYTIGGGIFTRYFLTDGIYPKYNIFVQKLGVPTYEKETLFCALQVNVRKWIERDFGVRFKRLGILDSPVRLWKADEMIYMYSIPEQEYLPYGTLTNFQISTCLCIYEESECIC